MSQAWRAASEMTIVAKSLLRVPPYGEDTELCIAVSRSVLQTSGAVEETFCGHVSRLGLVVGLAATERRFTA
jgi:hypothetical protein